MTKRPIIGIPTSLSHDSWGCEFLGNSQTYIRAIEHAGGVPLLLPTSENREVLDGLYGVIDGLLLAGGVDIHPDAYGHAAHPKLGSNNLEQDSAEVYLTKRAAADGKPILGICRGHQMLNVALGGTLFQDIPAEIAASLDHEFSSRQKDGKILAHDIQINEESWLAEALEQTVIKTNSMHHQSVRDVAPSLRVVGTTADGVVEVIESTGTNFAVGIQSHPEELWNTTETKWQKLFDAYIAEVLKH